MRRSSLGCSYGRLLALAVLAGVVTGGLVAAGVATAGGTTSSNEPVGLIVETDDSWEWDQLPGGGSHATPQP